MFMFTARYKGQT